jgi:Flp pilus assembly protein TadB
MAELIVVYQANPDNVQKAVQVLESRHLHPVILDEPEKASGYRTRNYLVRIGVPETERDMATHVLAEAERQSEAKLTPAMKTIHAAFIFMVVAAGLVVAIGLIDGGGKWFGATLIAVGLLFLALFLRAIRKQKPRA